MDCIINAPFNAVSIVYTNDDFTLNTVNSIDMTETSEMSSLWSVLSALHKKGYDTELLMTPKGLATEKGRLFAPGELKIIKTYRFEGASDPTEEVIVYLMEANDGFVGYSMDAYGVYSNHADDGYRALILKMVMQDRPEQQVY